MILWKLSPLKRETMHSGQKIFNNCVAFFFIDCKRCKWHVHHSLPVSYLIIYHWNMGEKFKLTSIVLNYCDLLYSHYKYIISYNRFICSEKKTILLLSLDLFFILFHFIIDPIIDLMKKRFCFKNSMKLPLKSSINW